MTPKEKQGFVNRITSSNATEIIAVLFDVYSCYTDDAKAALKKGRDAKSIGEYTDALRGASKVLRHLKNSLDFKYDISNDLYSLYDFCERSLAKAVYTLDVNEIDNTIKVMDQIGESFREIANKDKSPSIMKHAEKMSSGYTYGRTGMMDMVSLEKNRGLFV